MIICDSREQKNQHILDYLERNGIEHKIQAMETGDYMVEGKPAVLIDRKRNLNEVCTNLCSNDNSRFWREIRRSYRDKAKLTVLVEHGGKIKSISDVANWNSKYSRVTGRQLVDKMFQVAIAYGVDWQFCDKRSTGRRIIEILGGEKA